MYDGYRMMGLLGALWEWFFLAAILVAVSPAKKKGGVPRDSRR